jgi:hypothetical protein
LERTIRKNFWSYSMRFLLIHLVTWAVIASLFLLFKEKLPESRRVALDFFRPYRLGWPAVAPETIRGIILALVLFPFYDLFVKSNRGHLVLFSALWGLAILGSIEPLPGSFEGMIYTKTTFGEHLLVLVATAVQVFLFCTFFLRWEKRGRGNKA